jgi:hypothetical protein
VCARILMHASFKNQYFIINFCYPQKSSEPDPSNYEFIFCGGIPLFSEFYVVGVCSFYFLTCRRFPYLIFVVYKGVVDINSNHIL